MSKLEKIEVGKTEGKKQIVYTMFSSGSLNNVISDLKKRYEGLDKFIDYNENKNPRYACITVPKKDLGKGKINIDILDALLGQYIQKSEEQAWSEK